MVKELVRWHDNRNTFMLLQGVTLCGNFEDYAAVTVHFLQDKTLCAQPYPIFLNWTDNKTSQAWIKKAATRITKGKVLQRILCSLMINTPLGIKANFIPRVKKVLADAISRTYSDFSLSPSFKKYLRSSRR